MTDQANSQLGQPLDIDWAGKGSNYIRLGFKVFFLKIITLFIYHFWGKTEVRKKLWNHVRLNNEPLEYTGTGMELFLGFLITMFVVFVPAILALMGLAFAFGPESIQYIIGVICLYLFFLYLIGVAIYSAHKYRLSRTQWRGIRGSLNGSKWKYGWTMFWTTIVVIFSLGLASPWQSIKLQKIITDDTHFGETPMSFDGKTSDIFKYYIVPWIALLGGLVVLYFQVEPYITQLKSMIESGAPVPPEKTFMIQLKILAYYIGFILVMSVIYAWYQSKFYNYVAEKTHFSNGSFNLKTTGPGIMWLVISNFFIVALSLGILAPVAVARFFGYIVNNLSFNGNVDLAAIEQSQQPLSKTGEGLAEGFDVSTF